MASVERLNEVFDKIVEDSGDTIGYIAFASFVRARIENASGSLDAVSFAVSNTELAIYRQSATQDIDTLKENLLALVHAEMSGDIQAGILGEVRSDVSSLKQATSFKATIAANLFAWILSIGLTLLLVKAVDTPSPVNPHSPSKSLISLSQS